MSWLISVQHNREEKTIVTCFKQTLNSLPQTKCFFLFPAAAFFVTYESTKSFFAGYTAASLTPFTHMLGASLGEIVGFLLFFFLSCCFVLVFIIIYPFQSE